jgi:hypothetical protein
MSDYLNVIYAAIYNNFLQTTYYFTYLLGHDVYL